MGDLTILYYTANRISEYFGRKVRERLVKSAPGVPIISISHKPMDFGTNIVHKGPPSCYTLYKQILIGAMNAKTRYVACAEDDSLYPEEHFRFRPPDDTFAYNENRHNLHKEHFVFRDRLCMSTCIAPTALMVYTLAKRYEKYPEYIPDKDFPGGRAFAEPGRYEKLWGLENANMMRFSTEIAPIVFWHRPSLGQVRKILRKDIVKTELPYWGNARELWDEYYRHP